MQVIKSTPIQVIGLSIRTINGHDKAAQDIPALWQEFMSNNTIAKIPNRINDDLYCIYTEYEGDHTQAYTTVLGCAVSHLNELPEGMKGITIEAGTFEKHQAKGNLMEGVVFQAWFNIWKSPMKRAYTTDYEVYGPNTQNPEDAEVDIFVAT